MSPFLPVLVGFTFVVCVVLDEDPARWIFLTLQMGVVAILTLFELTGWAAALAPPGIPTNLSLIHVVTVDLVLGGMLIGVSRGARRARHLFETVLGRVGAARQDLLETHQAQAEELTALSGAIAHELKNPLASVKGLAGLLARDVREGKDAERLQVLRQEVDRMQAILEEFLNFSRPSVPLGDEPVALHEMCRDVVALHEGLARDRGVRLGVSGAGTARADARKTRQILINLLQNAIDASPAGGEVLLQVDASREVVAVAIADEGGGLDPAVAARVFEPGATTKPRGSGFGLTIARALARQQGGEVVLINRLPKGCRAELSLPAAGVS